MFAIVEPISLQPAPFPMVNHVTQVSHGNTLSTSQLRRRELKLLDDGYGKFDDHQERICVLYVCNMAQSIEPRIDQIKFAEDSLEKRSEKKENLERLNKIFCEECPCVSFRIMI